MQGDELNQVHYPMRRYVWRHFLVALFSIFIGAAVGAKAVSGPSVVVQRVEPDSVSYRGGDIAVKVSVRHNKDCPVVLHRWLGLLTDSDVNGTPTDWRYAGESYAPPIPVKQTVSFTIHITVPLNTPQGRYQVRTRAQDLCTMNPFQSPIRDSSFVTTIKDPTDDSPAPVLIPRNGKASLIKTPVK